MEDNIRLSKEEECKEKECFAQPLGFKNKHSDALEPLLGVLRIESRVLKILSKCSSIELCPSITQ